MERLGQALIAWVSAHYPAGHELVSYRARPFGVWRTPVGVSAGEFPEGALDPHGNGTIVWARLVTAHRSTFNVIDAAVHRFR